jgi:biotin transporter BioY
MTERILDRLLDMLEKSTLISGIIATGLIGAVIYLSIVNQPIPELLQNAALIIVGFFFGAKTQNSASIAALKRSIMDSGERDV